ncbi:MAG: ATP-binding protein [Phaeospirillum sp.]|nr:ATP-binding protein [Phaeospirillum sp.]
MAWAMIGITMAILKGYDRTRRAVIVSVVAITVAAWGLATAWLWGDYRHTITTAESELSRLSLAAAEQTHRLISLTDVFLDSLEQVITLSDGKMETLTGPAMTERVTRLLDHVDDTLDIAVIDHAGALTLLPYSAARRQVTVNDRDYVRDAKVGRITIAAPLQGRTSGEWIIPVSRRVADPNSRVAVLLAAIHIHALERVFDGIRHTKGGAIGLVRSDGVMLARSPPLDGAIGRSIIDGPVFREMLPLAADGPYTATSRIDGQERLGFYRSIPPQGMVVIVSRTLSEVLAPWRRQVWLSAAAMIAFTLGVAIAAALLLRLLATLENGARDLDLRVTERTAELHRLMEARSSFLTSISHELRTPLNAIIGFSDALLARLHGPIPIRQSEYIEDIHLSGRHLLTLVNDLLDSAAIDAGQFGLDEGDFLLAGMMNEAMVMVRPRAETARVTLHIAIQPESLMLRADRRRLMQAIINLSTNAIKYNHPGGRVSLTARIVADGDCAIVIADTGIGMSADGLKLALTPFGRIGAPAAHPVEGTGLGLPLTHRLVELHGGALTLDSEPGEGTTATITLPAARVRHIEPPAHDMVITMAGYPPISLVTAGQRGTVSR